MELLGDRNWWMPRWLDRLIPHLDIEGSDGADQPLDLDDSRELVTV
jgi:RND superfamily putative drug exporter